MALVQSAAFTASTRPVKTETLPGDYVLAIAPLASHYAVASSAPSSSIYLFDRANLQPVSHFTAHGNTSCMRTVPSFGGSARDTLVSCGTDWVVNVWDERTPSILPTVQSMSPIATSRQEINSTETVHS